MNTPRFSTDWHLDEPLAYLVKRHDSVIREYEIFLGRGDARRFAEIQEQLARDNGIECDVEIYPLYAGTPFPRDQ